MAIQLLVFLNGYFAWTKQLKSPKVERERAAREQIRKGLEGVWKSSDEGYEGRSHINPMLIMRGREFRNGGVHVVKKTNFIE